MKKVLIVEDDPPTQEALAFQLNRRGIPAVVVEDGETAIKRLQEEEFGLLLVDLLLPKRSGFDVIRSARSAGLSKNAEIIVWSNLGQKENLEIAKKLGADDYIVKADTGLHELAERIAKEVED